MKKITLLAMLMFTFFLGQQISAQTILIDPNGDGGFENGSDFATNGWTTANDALNTWNVGTVPGWFTGGKGAYVSNDSGTTWAYGTTTINRSHFYRDVAFPVGAESITLNFDWRANGNDTNWDNLLVYIMDTSITPTNVGPTTTNTTTTGWAGYTNGTTGHFLLQRNGTIVPTTTTAVTYSFTAAQLSYVSGTTKRLVFVWKNDGSGGTNPPASLDNISLNAFVPTCFTPSGVIASAVTKTTATIAWTAPSSAPSNGYEYEVRTSGAAGSGAVGLALSGTTPAGVVTSNLVGLTPSTNYSVYVRSNCGGSDVSSWTTAATFRTVCDYFDIAGTTPATICGQGTATLGATATGGTVNWYAASTGGTSLGTGNTFITPLITSTTSYWAEALSQDTNQTGGARVSTAAITGTTPSSYGLVFNATGAFVLNSVNVYLSSATAGNVVMQLQSNTGSVLSSTTIAVPAGNATTPVQFTLPLNFTVQPGTGYRLIAVSGPAMVRESALGGFPYAIGSVGSVTNGYIAGTSTTYYYFYNWNFTPVCSSPRTEVIATVTTAPVLTLSSASTAYCTGQSSSLVTISAGASDYDTYSWSPATGVSGNSVSGWNFNATSSTVYTLTASQSSGSLCSKAVTLNVNVNPLPNQPFINQAPSVTVCEGTVQQLSVTKLRTVVSGVGTSTSSGNVTSALLGPNPLQCYYGGTKQQWIYRPSELIALGFEAGMNINAIKLNLISANTTYALNNLKIKMKNTATANFASATAWETGLTTVKAAFTHTPTVGINSFTLDTPFAWDGTSNLVIEMNYSNANTGGSTTFNTAKYSATSFVSTIFYRADSASDATVDGFVGTASFTYSSRNDITFDIESTLPITWAPVTNLYTDLAATSPYVGGTSASTVYFKSNTPGGPFTYSATATTPASCTSTAIIDVTVSSTPAPTGATTQTIAVPVATDATIEDIVVTGTNVVWYQSLSDALSNINPMVAGAQVFDGITYYAVQTVGGCRSTSALGVTITVTLGVDSFNSDEFKAYPNPVKDVLNLSYSSEITSVSVYNMLGQKVLSKTLNAAESQLDMSDLSSGNYIVKVDANGLTKTIKVVKQ
jgi:type IX secretion system substrate protein/Ig-like domain-containing protein/fibronectin type III domain protein